MMLEILMSTEISHIKVSGTRFVPFDILKMKFPVVLCLSEYTILAFEKPAYSVPVYPVEGRADAHSNMCLSEHTINLCAVAAHGIGAECPQAH